MNQEEKVRTINILSDIGLHCRPSASFVKVANQFQSEIYVEKDGTKVSGKSIMGLLALGAGKGPIDVFAIGPDAMLALDALENLVKNNFEIVLA